MGQICFHLEKICVSNLRATWDHLVGRRAKFLYKIVTRKILGGQKNAFLMARTESHTEHKRAKTRKVKKEKKYIASVDFLNFV